MKFFASYVTGLSDPVVEILRKTDPTVKELTVYDGALTFEADGWEPEQFPPCFTNLFQVLFTGLFSLSEQRLPNPLDALMRSVLADRPMKDRLSDDVGVKDRNNGCQTKKTFRLMAYNANKPVSVNQNLKERLERLIVSATGMAVDRALPDEEYWMLLRNGSEAFFLKRLTRHRAYEKTLHRGALHPELAYVMNWLSEPQPDDVFLDPFCGFGSIPFQRNRYFAAEKIMGFDMDERKIAICRDKGVPKQPGILFEIRNVFSLAEDPVLGQIDKIVTDPPWGFYEGQSENMESFYAEILRIFAQILRNNGRIVWLCARSICFEEALVFCGGLSLVKKYDILVSGKKASIYIIMKRSSGKIDVAHGDL